MPKALPSFADKAFLSMLLSVAFEKWCEIWVRGDLDKKGWTEAEVQQVKDCIIPAVDKLYGTGGQGATMADAIKMRKEALASPGLERPLEMFEEFLNCNGCWLKGELANSLFSYRMITRWQKFRREQGRALHGSAVSGIYYEFRWMLSEKLGHQPTIAEAAQVKLADALATKGVKQKTVDVLNEFLADCGMKPLK